MKNKKMIIIIILVVLALLVIYALLTRPNGDKVLDKDKKELKVVILNNEFLSINNIINDYLLNVSLDNQDYIKGVTGSDILITNREEKDNYYLEKLYYVELNYNIYYYASGRRMTYDYETNKMNEIKNDCYLVNVYKPNDTYQLTKIDDINTYFNENDLYDKVIITHNDYNDYNKYDTYYKDDILYDNYINYFKDLLFVNYQDAYNLLDTTYKNKVGSVENFNNIRESLYNKLNNLVIDYSITGEEANRTYILILSNNTKITIVETGIMNVKYKIEN